ncbi:MAG: hypothetical protein ABI576_12650 [Flavobacterium sp.]
MQDLNISLGFQFFLLAAGNNTLFKIKRKSRQLHPGARPAHEYKVFPYISSKYSEQKIKFGGKTGAYFISFSTVYGLMYLRELSI